MKEFDELLDVANKLLGPNGCPWDLKQTFNTLQPYVVEEAHEVIEAVDSNEDEKIVEELGDLLYTIIFYAKLAEKEKRFDISNILNTVKEKLIRRHPHIFGDVNVENSDEVVKNWDEIKKKEKQGKPSEMPPSLPLLMRAQKILKKMKKAGSPLFSESMQAQTEEKIGEDLLNVVIRAEISHVDAESALRRRLNSLQQHPQKLP